MQTKEQAQATRAEKRAKAYPPPILYRPTMLAHMLGIGRTTLYQWEKEGKFPRRVNLADGVAGWLSADVDAWLAERAAKTTEAA